MRTHIHTHTLSVFHCKRFCTVFTIYFFMILSFYGFFKPKEERTLGDRGKFDRFVFHLYKITFSQCLCNMNVSIANIVLFSLISPHLLSLSPISVSSNKIVQLLHHFENLFLQLNSGKQSINLLALNAINKMMCKGIESAQYYVFNDRVKFNNYVVIKVIIQWKSICEYNSKCHCQTNRSFFAIELCSRFRGILGLHLLPNYRSERLNSFEHAESYSYYVCCVNTREVNVWCN